MHAQAQSSEWHEVAKPPKSAKDGSVLFLREVPSCSGLPTRAPHFTLAGLTCHTIGGGATGWVTIAPAPGTVLGHAAGDSLLDMLEVGGSAQKLT